MRPRARDHLAARGVRTEPDPAAHSPPLRLGTRAVLTPPSRLATVAGFSERSLHEQSLVSPNERRERGAGAPRLLVAHRAARKSIVEVESKWVPLIEEATAAQEKGVHRRLHDARCPTPHSLEPVVSREKLLVG